MFDPPRIYPSRHAWPISTANLDDAPHNAERIRLVNRGTGFDKLSEFKSLSALWCYGIDQKKLTHISECTSLCNLYLDYQLRIDDLLPLQRLPRLDVLRLDSCSKITSLQRLSDLKQLTGLAIENFKNVHDIQPLSVLTNLKELAIEGSIWTRMKIDSLSPIMKLTGIEFLSLTNLKVADESLKPLSKLTSLRELHVANFYPFGEFARLAAVLPQCKCQWFAPYVSTSLKCEKCNDNRVLVTGKGKSLMCVTCDSARLARHVADFERIRNSSIKEF